MQILPTDELVDEQIRKELGDAGIPVVSMGADDSTGDVLATYKGQLGEFTFVRFQYYWRVEGQIPLEVAQRLYGEDMYAGPTGDQYFVNRCHIDTPWDLKRFVAILNQHGRVPAMAG